MTIAFGHGLSITPMHIASGVAAMVNGGIKIEPTLVKRDQPAAGTRVIKPETSAALRQLMRLVVERGTGRSADAPGYNVGGKTGTAEKSIAHGYKHDALLSSFVGAFPSTRRATSFSWSWMSRSRTRKATVMRRAVGLPLQRSDASSNGWPRWSESLRLHLTKRPPARLNFTCCGEGRLKERKELADCV